jgi:hypothetical protein
MQSGAVRWQLSPRSTRRGGPPVSRPRGNFSTDLAGAPMSSALPRLLGLRDPERDVEDLAEVLADLYAVSS